MQKLVVTEFMSLDGVMEASDYKHKELFATDALLLGRVTYEGFAAAWPGRTDETGFADRFNSLPKYVASTTLETADWNNSTVINGDVAQEVSRLKREPGQNIAVHGSATLVRSLMEHDLIDEYRLLVYPLVLGTGKRLFGDSITTKLKLVESQRFSTGVTALTYEPDRSTTG